MNEQEHKKLLFTSTKFGQQYLNHKICMAYDKKECKGKICEAHIVSEKYLRNIADKNHVYTPSGSLFHNDFYEFTLKGVNKATCIPVFCEYHDNILFESFEKQEFKSRYKQVYALTFRSLCREFSQKRSHSHLVKDIASGETEHGDAELFKQSNQYQQSKIAIEKQMAEHTTLYYRLKKCKQNGLRYFLIELEDFPIAATGIFFPEYDAIGKRIQKRNHTQHGFIYNFIPLKNITYVIIATVASHSKLDSEYLRSIYNLNNQDILNYLITYIFLNNDCIAIRPMWFDNLEKNKKDMLSDLINFRIGEFHITGKFEPVKFFSPSPQLSVVKTLKGC